MNMQAEVRQILQYLQKNPQIRSQIRAPADKTLLYAGRSIKPVWQEIADLRMTNAQVREKSILPDVLAHIPTPGAPYVNLLQWVKALDHLTPWQSNGFIVWRALSGIFAANAIGKVSFLVGSGVTKQDKVFAATELAVLSRNPNIDPITQDTLAYYLRCVQTKNPQMNFGFIAG
jgi:hypothetical protein